MAGMKDMLDIKTIVEVYNDVLVGLNDIKEQLAEKEKYVNNIEDPYNVNNNVDTDVLEASEDSEDLEDFADFTNDICNHDIYLTNIDDMKNIENMMANGDMELDDMIDMYEKSHMIMQDLIHFLDNQKLKVVNIH